MENKLTKDQIDRACFYYKHDFFLIHEDEKEEMRLQCAYWYDSLKKSNADFASNNLKETKTSCEFSCKKELLELKNLIYAKFDSNSAIDKIKNNTELESLQKKICSLETTLKVIRTWAEIEALSAEEVVKIIDLCVEK